MLNKKLWAKKAKQKLETESELVDPVQLAGDSPVSVN
jgi:hypothetical protein